MARQELSVSEKRDLKVVKSNELIRKSRYQLSVTEQKTIAYICSIIDTRKIDDVPKNVCPYQLDYSFDVLDYCRVCGIETSSGKNYSMVKSVLKSLRDRSMWMTLKDGSEVTVAWLDRVHIDKYSGVVSIRLDEYMVPFLFELKGRFTKYDLFEILGMKSSYSIRLFELFKSYEWQHEKTFEVQELKRLLMVENIKTYENFKNFRIRVIEPAISEINECSYMCVTYTTKKTGRKITHITFTITEKGISGEDGRLKAMENTEKRLEGRG